MFYLHMHIRRMGKVDPTSLIGCILGVRFREAAVSFTFCFIHLYVLGFVTYILL